MITMQRLIKFIEIQTSLDPSPEYIANALVRWGWVNEDSKGSPCGMCGKLLKKPFAKHLCNLPPGDNEKG